MKPIAKTAAVAVLALGSLLAAVPTRAQNPAATVTVDARAGRHPIDPRIYGVAFATEAELLDLRAPLHRWGGNHTSRYNWQLNADNRAFDWYFESLPYSDPTPGGEADSFVATSLSGGAQPMLTVPVLGYVAGLGTGRTRRASFSAARYGAQADCDWTWYPDACNGVHTDGTPVTGNDPLDASVVSTSAFQKQWVEHLVETWGAAGAGGVGYYFLDNEPSIWHSTHRDVHPVGATMDEVRDRLVDYAARVREADPGALLAGPEEWGWGGYVYSGYDLQWGSTYGWGGPLPDRTAHGGMDFLPWLLQALREADQASGARTLDLFTVHYYPQGGEYGNDVSTATCLLRNRSTRSLWDPDYVDESWISDTVRLIPRLKAWVAAGYPGLPVGVTEYNWGAEDHINGATAQADVLGIFGREGLDLATRWTTPDPSTPTYKAMKLYRNHDGAGGAFGDVSVSTTAPSPDDLSAFGALRSADGALTVVVVNKDLSGTTSLTLSWQGFSASGPAAVWQLTSANTITRLPDLAPSGSTLSTTLPAPSVTLFVVPGSARRDVGTDFDGDGRADLFWRQATTGADAVWTMNGAAVAGAGYPPTVAGPWTVVAAADLDGDRRADVVWRNPLSGENAVWLMDGATVAGSGWLPAVDPAWAVAGAGDLDGDSREDLLWRNPTTGQSALWLMDGAAVTAGSLLPTVAGAWTAQVADADGDGRGDLLWFDPASGQTAVWLMAGGTIRQGALGPAVAAGWEVATTGDLGGDGKADLVWRHAASGENAVWMMDGTTVASGSVLPAVGAPWTLAGAGDFDGDGRDDLLWHEATGGRSAVWFMDGTAVASAGEPPPVADTTWAVALP